MGMIQNSSVVPGTPFSGATPLTLLKLILTILVIFAEVPTNLIISVAYNRGWQPSVKGWIVNILGFVGYRVPAAALQLCPCCMKAARDIHKGMSMTVF